MKKRVVSFISALCLTFCLCACGSAPQRELHDCEESVAVVKLTVYATGERGKVAPLLSAAGHAYTSVENLTDLPLTLGKGYVLPTHATVTIASWEFDAHGGVWYNIEPTYIDQGWFVKRKSITRNVDAAGLERMNSFLIQSENDKWTLFQNCTHFAANLWNAVVEGSGDEFKTKGLLTPSQLEKQIVKFKAHEVGRPHKSDTPIGYYSGNDFILFTLSE